MKIPIIDLTLENALALRDKNDWSDHFKLIVWPRMLVWLGLKEQFKDEQNIEWKIFYSPDNMHSNMISIHIKDPNNTFNFYFQVPLVQKLSLNLYLGDSTYNFFEIHPLLISKGIIKENEIPIQATSTILPHLVLSTENSKYDKEVLWKINQENYTQAVKNDPIINLLTMSFKKYIAPLKKIIYNEWNLQKSSD
ncbi:hypothetical protein E9993_13155 [Labilibacter sediminis]|nr:hypothetical protein E9993_13155 [Labilibacter sediminis]